MTLPSDPGEGGTSDSAVATVDSALGAGGGSRIEIELFPGELVAREVHVEADDAEEKIVSPVTAIDPGQGTLTLELGGLTVSYDCEHPVPQRDESHESRQTWEAAVQGEIAAGGGRWSKPGGTPPALPRLRSDPPFIAADLRLENERDEPQIEIYVDGRQRGEREHLGAVLRVLGLVHQVNGRTRLGPDDNGGSGQPSGDVGQSSRWRVGLRGCAVQARHDALERNRGAA